MNRSASAQNSSSKIRLGFTLVELLVVIAIIGILAALIIPSISSGIARSKRLACLSNLRQLSQGCQIFIESEGPALPNRELGCGHWGNAASDLLPYLNGNVRIFVCPANKHPLQTPETEILPDAPGTYTMYEFNGYLCSCAGFKRRLADILSYSEAAYAYDYPYAPSATHRAHKGGVNCAYMDGHALWLADEDMGPLTPDTEETFYKRGHRCWQ